MCNTSHASSVVNPITLPHNGWRTSNVTKNKNENLLPLGKQRYLKNLKSFKIPRASDLLLDDI